MAQNSLVPAQLTVLEVKGRILKGVAGQYTVDTPQGQYICNARGLFRKNKISPIVGDWVEISIENSETGQLMTILPRSNELKRPKVANVDQVLIVLASARPSFSFTMLDRYLMQSEHEEIEAAICINKTDLDAAIAEEVYKIYKNIGYTVFSVSVKESDGLQPVQEYLQSKTTVLAGPSGVGKSSLINRLTGRENMPTGIVSEKIGRGKHTTRHAEFIPISTGAYVIDTPGFSSLEPPDIPLSERAMLFKEFLPHLGQCKFSDCFHNKEIDCAVKEQVGVTIHPSRYARYIEWLNE